MEFEIKGQQYRSGKLDAFKQFHVSRRLAPVLSGMASLAESPQTDFTELLQPVAEAIAHMPDSDCDYILQTCLSVVQRQQGNAWANVYAPNTKALMFDDVDLSTMLQIAVKVIQDNLAGFFSAGVSALKPQTPA
jgi:hypothetical protein